MQAMILKEQCEIALAEETRKLPHLPNKILIIL